MHRAQLRSRVSANGLFPTRRVALGWLTVATALGLCAAGAPSALAYPHVVAGPSDADLELVLLHGTKDAAGKIPPGYDELTNPPWNAYNHYDVIDTRKIGLTKGNAISEQLPDGSKLEAKLLETGPKFKVEVVVKDTRGTKISTGKYSASKGTRFMPVWFPYRDGNLVISLRLL